MSTSEARCPLCGSNLAARLYTKRGTDYWACGDCTFRFATPDVNPNLTTALEGYEDAYLQYLAPDASDAANFDALSRWMAGFAPLEGRRLLCRCRERQAGAVPPRARVDAHGIEPSWRSSTIFLPAIAFTARRSAKPRLDPRTFDIVTAFDVIEHVPDPPEFLRAVSTLLEPGGVLRLHAGRRA
jgi:SAM-dependent methyltransferase